MLGVEHFVDLYGATMEFDCDCVVFKILAFSHDADAVTTDLLKIYFNV